MNLTKIRNARGLSLKDLGDMIDMDPSTIQRAETMHKSAKMATYVACAKALDVPLASLFMEDLSPSEVRIIEAFRSRSDAQRARMAELLDLIANPLSQEGE